MNIRNEVITKIQKLARKNVSENDNLTDLNLDSLDLAELIVDIESQYEIRIPDEELNNLKTVSDVIVLFEKLVCKNQK